MGYEQFASMFTLSGRTTIVQYPESRIQKYHQSRIEQDLYTEKYRKTLSAKKSQGTTVNKVSTIASSESEKEVTKKSMESTFKSFNK